MAENREALPRRSESRFMQTVRTHCARLGVDPMQGIEETEQVRPAGWRCSACGRPVAITGMHTISCPEHPRAAVRR